MKRRIIACPNCYYGFLWNGVIRDLECPNCGFTIPIPKMARSLVHLFCAVSIRGQRWAYELLRFLTEMGWGDGCFIGRHDWVIAGCPIDIEDICRLIQNGNEFELSSISRLISSQTVPQFIIDKGREKIGSAAVSRLKEGEPNTLLRERLYYILNNFPVKEGVEVLEQMARTYPDEDGDEKMPTGEALREALEKCRNVAQEDIDDRTSSA